MVKIVTSFAVALTLTCALPVLAEPTSGPVNIRQLRPYIGGNTVYVYVIGNGPCGALGGAQSIYTIDISSATGKAAYGVLLTAVTTGKPVLLEVIADACGQPYPGLQSVYAIS